MDPVDFANRKIAEWQEKSRVASENADLAAFEFAEREIKTYKDMAESWFKRLSEIGN